MRCLPTLAVVLRPLVIAALLVSPLALYGQLGGNPSDQPNSTVIAVTDGPVLKVYALKNLPAGSAHAIVQSLLTVDPVPGVKVMTEERTNSLIVLAEEEIHARMSEVISTIDLKPANAAEVITPRVANFVAMVIMDAKEGSWTADADQPDKGTRDTLDDLKSQGLLPGFSDPRVVATGVVRIQSNGEPFTLQSSAKMNVFRMSVKGRLTPVDSSNFSLNSQFVIEELSQDQAHTSRIESDTLLEAGHPVLLSVNTIDGRNCLILVSIR